MDTISILVIDDHPLFRQGVIDAISLESDIKVIGQASTGENAVGTIRSLKPDIVLLDVNLPGMNGQQIAHQVSSQKLTPRIILMSGYDDVEQSLHAAMAGAAAYFAKEIEPKALLGIIRDVAAGSYVFGAQTMSRRQLQKWIEDQIEAAPRPYSEPGSPFHPLSDREMQVLESVLTGLSNKEIAGLLGISHQTVKNHVTSILRKFGVEDRTQAVVYALQHGWVRLRDLRRALSRKRLMNPDTQPSLAAPIDLQTELAEAQKAQREITLMIEQSQNELTKLAQRNASINAHLQLVQARIDQVPAAEVRMAYDAALDAQQRLFVMRGQLDKLQSDKDHLERYRSALERLGPAESGPTAGQAAKPKGSVAEIEMVVNAQEAERQRLSRQMHDGPAQAMSNFILQTEIAMRLMDIDPKKAKDELASLKGSALGTFQKLRNFIFELRPMMLDDLGLAPTIRKYIEAFKEQTALDASLAVTGTERRLEPYLEVMIFRAVQELLGNAARHSQAAGVKIQVDMGNDAIRVSVDDNGRGFDPEAAEGHSTLGLRLIRERVEMLGGTFSVDSALGKGARIMFTAPVHS